MTVRRNTRQRAAVAALLAGSADFRSAQQIHEELREQGSAIGLATVYRTLQTMVDDGAADVLRTAEGESAYRACERHEHHHLVCRACGAAVEIDGPDVEAWARRVAAAHGYTQVDHTLELFGLCPACTLAAAERDAESAVEQP